GPERSFEYNNLDLDIQRALDELAPEFRAAVVLCDLEGLSYEEVAEALGVKLGTVRSRIHRGRSQLRVKLSHRAPHTPASRSRAQVGPAVSEVR
ncbi:MAG TPA: sigma-70 family RNA polymerase sigma factor, partial [Arthrobacter sp.]|nr:sigma-70 family RNA polymerase sigma factor [Arthrobacter sp.]